MIYLYTEIPFDELAELIVTRLKPHEAEHPGVDAKDPNKCPFWQDGEDKFQLDRSNDRWLGLVCAPDSVDSMPEGWGIYRYNERYKFGFDEVAAIIMEHLEDHMYADTIRILTKKEAYSLMDQDNV